MTTESQIALAGAGFEPVEDGHWQLVGRTRRVEAVRTADGGLEIVGVTAGNSRPVWRNQLSPGYTPGTARVLLVACARWVSVDRLASAGPLSSRLRPALDRLEQLATAG